MGAVSLKGIRKRWGTQEVLRGLDLEIADGEFMVFVGPSGCGKSTTLRLIAGLDALDEGELHIGGTRADTLHPAERGVAMVFQSYALYPHMTVAENMGFALRMAGVSRAEREQRVREAADILRLTPLLERRPAALSGGQRQRVAIGRAIVRRPQVFLFDEPLSNLDAALRVDMRVELKRLHEALGTTMVYVTHDQVEAMTLGDRIAVFDQGRIAQVGRPLDLYRAPADTFVAGFLGSPRINLVTRPTEGASAAHRALWHVLGGEGSHAAQLGVRPEHLALAPAGTGVTATVVLAEQLGDSSIVHLKVEGMETLLSLRCDAGHDAPAHGDRVGITVTSDLRHAFDAQGLRLKAA
jgi:multiple sugar transport system ATP-binding protein